MNKPLSLDVTIAEKVQCPCVGVSHVMCGKTLPGEALLNTLRENA